VTSYYISGLNRALTEKAAILAQEYGAGLPHLGDDSVRKLAHAARARITVIAPDGRVLSDSEAAHPERLENHRHRPEVARALAGATGSSIRRSPTLGIDFLYVAVPVAGRALRLAMPLSEIDEHVSAIRRQTIIALGLAFLPAVAVAALLARHVSGRLGAIIRYAAELSKGNYRARLRKPGGGELGMLAARLNETGEHLEREHEKLEKIERVRKDFVMNVSHELRTPLAAIQGYTETLLDGALDDRANNLRFLRIIRQNAERLGRLVADLMTLSQIELQTRTFHPAPHELNDLLTDIGESMQPMAEKKRIAIHVQPASAQVFCDSQAIFQVLANLLDNAIKYTPEGGSIAVRSEVRDGKAEVAVRDTGMGIPAEDVPRLFERFYRVDKARSRELGGTGLGLSIVRHLVMAQGGEVRVESEPGKGSTFAFTLPLVTKL
jgi:two-component system phosphate regulon sensor histidine kinase PhoR